MQSVVWNIFRRDKKWRCTCTVCRFATRLRRDGSTTVMLKHHKAGCGRMDQGHKGNTPLSPRLTLYPIMEENDGQQNILVTLLTDMPKEEPIKQHRLFSSPVAGISMAAGQREWETEYQQMSLHNNKQARKSVKLSGHQTSDCLQQINQCEGGFFILFCFILYFSSLLLFYYLHMTRFLLILFIYFTLYLFIPINFIHLLFSLKVAIKNHKNQSSVLKR